MRSIPPAFQAKLDSGVTTLCRCWIVTRRDDVVQGFTDHDEDIVIGATTCRAGTGVTGTEIAQKHGLAVDSSELSGALNDDTLNEDALAAGHYDAAAVEVWLVDWSEPPRPAGNTSDKEKFDGCVILRRRTCAPAGA